MPRSVDVGLIARRGLDVADERVRRVVGQATVNPGNVAQGRVDGRIGVSDFSPTHNKAHFAIVLTLL
jgi:hypothetical protein